MTTEQQEPAERRSLKDILAEIMMQVRERARARAMNEGGQPYYSERGRRALLAAKVPNVDWALEYMALAELDAEVRRSLEGDYKRLSIWLDSANGNYSVAAVQDGAEVTLGTGPTYSDALIAARLRESQANGESPNPAGPDAPPVLRDDDLMIYENDGNAFAAIASEVGRARRQFPSWPSDVVHAGAIVGEEAGELLQACLQATYERRPDSDELMRREAIQTAAMCVRFLCGV